jgi:uncharacterized protein YbaR (Trm112 family)
LGGNRGIDAVKLNALNVLVCPACKSPLRLTTEEEEDRGEVVSGQLQCAECSSEYPILRGVPRFVAMDSHADSDGPIRRSGVKA